MIRTVIRDYGYLMQFTGKRMEDETYGTGC